MARRRIRRGDGEGGRGILVGGRGGEGGTGSHPLEVRSCRAAQYRGNITLLPSFIPRNPAERQKHQPSSSSPGRFPLLPRYTRATTRSFVPLSSLLPRSCQSARLPLLSSSCPNFIPRSPPHTRARLHPATPPSRPLCFNNTVYIGTRSIDLFARRPPRVRRARRWTYRTYMDRGWFRSSNVFGRAGVTEQATIRKDIFYGDYDILNFIRC